MLWKTLMSRPLFWPEARTQQNLNPYGNDSNSPKLIRSKR